MILILLLLSIVPMRDLVVRDRCTCIEDQFFYDQCGKLVFEQHIFIDWFHDDEVVVDWRLVKSAAQDIHRDWINGGYVVSWLDGDTWREVRSKEMRRTWDQFDWEVMQRDKLPKEKRRGLSVPRRVR